MTELESSIWATGLVPECSGMICPNNGEDSSKTWQLKSRKTYDAKLTRHKEEAIDYGCNIKYKYLGT
jgi:hypothetical protein